LACFSESQGRIFRRGKELQRYCQELAEYAERVASQDRAASNRWADGLERMAVADCEMEIAAIGRVS
jgi:hypothetical protein